MPISLAEQQGEIDDFLESSGHILRIVWKLDEVTMYKYFHPRVPRIYREVCGLYKWIFTDVLKGLLLWKKVSELGINHELVTAQQFLLLIWNQRPKRSF